MLREKLPDPKAQALRTLKDNHAISAKAIDAPRDELGNTPLLESVYLRDHPRIILLLAAGADINKPNKREHSPLSRAVALSQLEIVRTLMQHSPDVTQKSTEFYPAKHCGFIR